jgi:hypothetical protein
MRTLYAITAALLVVHEIDSAYWREWELFGLPGGIAAFLAIHVLLVLLVLWGHERVIAASRAGSRMAMAVGAAGVATAAIHGAFLLRGSAAFRTAPSLAVIGACCASGIALIAAAARTARGTAPSR